MQKMNSAKLRIKESLSYSLGSVLLEYGGGLYDKDFKSTTSFNQNLSSTTSALANKTKQNLSWIIKQRFSLKSFILLLFKLYSTQNSHQRARKLYKDLIFLYPQFQYPPLELCMDYKEALVLLRLNVYSGFYAQQGHTQVHL